MLRNHLTFHHHIIYVDFDVLPQLWLKHSCHHSLICGSYIFQTEWHYFVMVVPDKGNNSSLLLIVQVQRYLMITLEGSKKLIRGWPTVASTSWFILGIGNGSLGQALFKSVKSTYTRHFPLFFFTTTVFANHSGYKTSWIALTCLSLVTSSRTASTCSLEGRRGSCFLGAINGLTFKWW